eukprot:gnl/TRDRNA2_/TRDRNA2_161693_c0_seq1.p1 gnl/TRDRNA2_/TRDRNA2_161693_c0~~gnl/TRDRNA2_/TRDRNA2_161693_c0_seq1.p1  ORF type:complete len:481 (-),score=48.96 gnl/TRDRNA2_/TRDRNA2_161693_c0_seq1:210-1631(-)
MGYHKLPMMIVTSLIGCTAYWFVYGLEPDPITTKDVFLHGESPELSIDLLVFFLVAASIQMASCDVLIEARVATVVRDAEKNVGWLIPFMTSGWLFGQIAASALYPVLTDDGKEDPRQVFGVNRFVTAVVFVSILLNFLGEPRSTPQEVVAVRNKLFEYKEVLCLGLLVAVGATLSCFLQVMIDDRFNRLVASLTIAAVLLCSLNIVIRPEIARIMTYFTMVIMLRLKYSGATFYFYTDNHMQYPDGPHFKPHFLNTTVNLVSGAFMLIGIGIYVRYMTHMKYRHLYVISVVTMSLLSIPDIILFSRKNKDWGIPDEAFVLGMSALEPVIDAWVMIISLTALTKSCPSGMESTIFALLASYGNFSGQVSNFAGAYVLHKLDVTPKGLPNESNAFDNLPKVSTICMCAPLLSIPLAFLILPDTSPDDDVLVGDKTSPVYGSPLDLWLRGRNRAEVADVANNADADTEIVTAESR